MNSFINEQGKRSWCRTDEIDRILSSFSLLEGYRDEIDTLIGESLEEVGFSYLPSEERYYLRSQNTHVFVFKDSETKWIARVQGSRTHPFSWAEEPVLIPRALWGDIRMAWDRFKEES